MSEQLTFGSLCAGIGGFDLGFERAGMECIWQVEKDEYCQKVLTKHWPNVEKFGDIHNAGKHNLQTVNVICGGFPCQPHSYAGSRQASQDKRDLWGEFARIIGEIKPRWVVAENVPGLLSSENGRYFGGILRDLAEMGYDAEWNSIPASTFDSIHIRQRIFILAYSKCNRFQGWQIIPPQRSENSRKEQLSGLLQSCFRTTLSKPNNDRNIDEVPHRVDRLRSLGNAVVPQVAQFIGELIVKANNEMP